MRAVIQRVLSSSVNVEGKEIVKKIYVPGRIYTIVIK